ncbi:dTDP-4-dehydrorhamnose reductase, partial [hydrothermal vent metagenome]
MNKTILVTGAKGQLGRSIQVLDKDYPSFTFTYVDIDDLNLCDAQAVEHFLEQNAFDVIINCAAYTAVDKAESEPELADAINHLAVKHLASIAKQKDVQLIHISTDYVFNGNHFQPYLETDTVDPKSVYGITKLNGERAFQEIAPKGIIVRTSWVYSEFGNNFVKTMLRLGQEKTALNIIFDQIGTPTYAGDLAKAILDIVQSNAIQPEHTNDPIYHYTNEGVCSWYDFAQHIFAMNQIDCQAHPI